MKRKVISSVIYGIAAGIMLIFILRSVNFDNGNSFSPNSMTTSIKLNPCYDIESCTNQTFEVLNVLNSKKITRYSIDDKENISKMKMSIKDLILDFSNNYNCEISYLNKKSFNLINYKADSKINSENIQTISEIDEILLLKIENNLESVFQSNFNNTYQAVLSNMDNKDMFNHKGKFEVLKEVSGAVLKQYCIVVNETDHHTVYYLSGNIDVSKIRCLQNRKAN